MEVSPSTDDRILEEKVVAVPLAALPSMEEKAPSGGMTEEVGQIMQDVQATHDPEAPQLPISQDPQLEQTFNPIKSVSPKPILSKETLGARLYPYKQVSPHLPLIRMLNLTPLVSLSLSLSLFFFF